MSDATTITVPVDSELPAEETINQAIRVLKDGGLVAYPTDTVYGLAVDPRLEKAVENLFCAKGRPHNLAIPLIGADVNQVERSLGALTPIGRKLADRFWPGPLTLIVKAVPDLSGRLLGGGDSVAVRVPDHSVARALAFTLGFPVTSTSVNRTGADSAATAGEAVEALGSFLSLVLDSGPSDRAMRSTIVDVRSDSPVLVRNGVVTWDRVVQSLS